MELEAGYICISWLFEWGNLCCMWTMALCDVWLDANNFVMQIILYLCCHYLDRLYGSNVNLSFKKTRMRHP